MTPPPRRIGHDDSIIPVTVGPVGIAVMRWMPLVMLYLAVVLGLGWYSDSLGWQPATRAAQIGPALIGMLDLIRRLRTTHYAWRNPAGGISVSAASIVDRLTFRECGWYFPLIALPLPLWLLGAMITLVALS
ncbi:MAG: hypothetical protein AB7G62_12395 [Magnetospirillum sp.]